MIDGLAFESERADLVFVHGDTGTAAAEIDIEGVVFTKFTGAFCLGIDEAANDREIRIFGDELAEILHLNVGRLQRDIETRSIERVVAADDERAFALAQLEFFDP